MNNTAVAVTVSRATNQPSSPKTRQLQPRNRDPPHPLTTTTAAIVEGKTNKQALTLIEKIIVPSSGPSSAKGSG